MAATSAAVLPAGWLVPTLRATAWSPLLAGAGGLLLVGAAIDASGASPEAVVGLASAGLAAALVAGLHDPAANTLGAVPISLSRRRLQRLVLLTPVAVASWIALLALARLGTPDWAAGWPVGPLVALAAAGLAVATWAPVDRQVPAGVALPLLWFMLHLVLVGTMPPDGVTGELLAAWRDRPWVVCGLALVAVGLGWRRR